MFNFTYRLGHDVSYSIIAEMTTENLIKDQQMNDIILPSRVNTWRLALFVADITDHLEEALGSLRSTLLAVFNIKNK